MLLWLERQWLQIYFDDQLVHLYELELELGNALLFQVVLSLGTFHLLKLLDAVVNQPSKTMEGPCYLVNKTLEECDFGSLEVLHLILIRFDHQLDIAVGLHLSLPS